MPYFVPFYFSRSQQERGLIAFGPADNSEIQCGISESGNSACAGWRMLNDSDPVLPSSGSALQGEIIQASDAVSGTENVGEPS